MAVDHRVTRDVECVHNLRTISGGIKDWISKDKDKDNDKDKDRDNADLQGQGQR